MNIYVLLSLLISLASPAHSAPQTCDEAATIAARETGVPLNILQAITRVETGRLRNGQAQPWPWTLNEGGAGHWFDSRPAAQTHLDAALRQGVRNIDIGCFQINYRWHSDQFRNASSMLEPLSNARYAARHLRSLFDQSGDWHAAAGRYHSATPALAAKYLARFRRELDPPAGAARNPQRAGADWPLLQPGEVISAGSLLRVAPGAVPLLRGPVPRLFGG